MKKLLVVVALFSLFSIPALAQDVPKAEVYGGYGLLTDGDYKLHGFVGAFEGNVNKTLSIVGEFGAAFKTVTEMDVDVKLKNYTFLGGPRISYRTEKVRPFGHVLFGGNHITGGSDVEGITVGVGETNFAMAFGGGLDLSLNKTISIRPVQFDVITVRYSILGMSGWDNLYRYSGGIVFKFGEK